MWDCCAGPGEDSGLDAVMVRVRSQNAVLRSTLESLATARSELAVRGAETKHLQRQVAALRGQHATWHRNLSRAGRAALLGCPTAIPYNPASPHVALESENDSPAKSVAHSFKGMSAVALPPSTQLGDPSVVQELEEQLETKAAKIEALEAALEVTRSRETEWDRLMGMYDSQRATVITQQQELGSLENQVYATLMHAL